MRDPHMDPLPPEIEALLDRERQAYLESRDLKAAVLDRVELAVGLGGGPGERGAGGAAPDARGGSGAARRSGLGGARAMALVAVGAFVAGGAAGIVVGRRSATVQATRTTVQTVPEVAAPVAVGGGAPAIASETSPIVAADAGTAAPAVSGAPREAPSARGDLVRERELLDAAHAALARGRPADAIAAASRLAQKWPNGYLVEEREAVWIEALAAAGEHGEAELRARRFRAKFPSSVFMPIVTSALAAP